MVYWHFWYVKFYSNTFSNSYYIYMYSNLVLICSALIHFLFQLNRFFSIWIENFIINKLRALMPLCVNCFHCMFLSRKISIFKYSSKNYFTPKSAYKLKKREYKTRSKQICFTIRILYPITESIIVPYLKYSAIA